MVSLHTERSNILRTLLSVFRVISRESQNYLGRIRKIHKLLLRSSIYVHTKRFVLLRNTVKPRKRALARKSALARIKAQVSMEFT